jgi:hypothetical protein
MRIATLRERERRFVKVLQLRARRRAKSREFRRLTPREIAPLEEAGEKS